MAKTRVYYNGACPVCAAGIRQQKRKLDGCDTEVDWIDVHENNDRARDVGTDLEFVRERLHVVDEAGELQVGSAAFTTLWALTPGQGLLAKLSGLPVLRPLFHWAYNLFAARLYKWNRKKGRW